MPETKVKPGNQQISDLREKIAVKKDDLKEDQEALAKLIESCPHTFEIRAQGTHVTADETQIFKQWFRCQECGEERWQETQDPCCLDCHTLMPETDERDRLEHGVEFLASTRESSGAHAIFSMGMDHAYRCPKCGRPHVYGDRSE